MVQRDTGLRLTAQQQAAVRTALTERVTVMTGGPGTGKTTCTLAIIRLLDAARRSYVLASPTGRAAKRLGEATGKEAKTIHRLLEWSPGGAGGFTFQRNEENPLDVDMVIVDEASMLDLLLTNHLLKAIPPGAHLLLVGDIDQLPPVGAGNVLRDVIDSGAGRGGAAGRDLPSGRRQLHHRERAPHQPRPDARMAAGAGAGLLSLPDRRPGAGGRAGGGGRAGAHPAQVRHPGRRRAGAQPYAPRGRGRGRAERAPAGRAQPAGRQPSRSGASAAASFAWATG
ncbi:MAG: AAA family ATPase [Anaerolineae bacterium]